MTEPEKSNLLNEFSFDNFFLFLFLRANVIRTQLQGHTTQISSYSKKYTNNYYDNYRHVAIATMHIHHLRFFSSFFLESLECVNEVLTTSGFFIEHYINACK